MTNTWQRAILDFDRRIVQFTSYCNAAGIRIKCLCRYRKPETQDMLYSYGRTRPGKIVTYARSYQSPHCWFLAADFVVLINGKPCWNTSRREWKTFVESVRKAGLRSGADFKKIHDYCHVEYPRWRNYIPRNNK